MAEPTCAQSNSPAGAGTHGLRALHASQIGGVLSVGRDGVLPTAFLYEKFWKNLKKRLANRTSIILFMRSECPWARGAQMRRATWFAASPCLRHRSRKNQCLSRFQSPGCHQPLKNIVG